MTTVKALVVGRVVKEIFLRLPLEISYSLCLDLKNIISYEKQIDGNLCFFLHFIEKFLCDTAYENTCLG